jgi:hypothetical protein
MIAMLGDDGTRIYYVDGTLVSNPTGTTYALVFHVEGIKIGVVGTDGYEIVVIDG